jgi:hypothetical protein
MVIGQWKPQRRPTPETANAGFLPVAYGSRTLMFSEGQMREA